MPENNTLHQRVVGALLAVHNEAYEREDGAVMGKRPAPAVIIKADHDLVMLVVDRQGAIDAGIVCEDHADDFMDYSGAMASRAFDAINNVGVLQ